jgi:TonB family protein
MIQKWLVTLCLYALGSAVFAMPSKESLPSPSHLKDATPAIQKYFSDVTGKVMTSWKQFPNIRLPNPKVIFKILPDGQVKDIHISKSSTNSEIDASIIAAVKSAAPFEPIVVSPYDKTGVDAEIVFDICGPFAPPEEFNKINIQNRQCIAKGDWQSSIALLKHNLELYPDDPDLKQALINTNKQLDPKHWQEMLAQSAVTLAPHKYVLLEISKKPGSTRTDNILDLTAIGKLVDGAKTISSIRFEPVSSTLTGDGKILGDKGFSGRPQLISFRFEYPACDSPYGDIILFIKNNKLYYGLTVSGSANEQIVANYHVIFPADKNGKPNQITVIHTFRDAETGKKTSADIREVYVWNGTTFKCVDRSGQKH